MLTALSVASLLWWLVCLIQPPGASPIWSGLLTGSLSVLAAYVCERRLGRQLPRSLRWDGQSWLLGPATSRGSEKRQGELLVVLDLGDWILLRCAAAALNGRERERSYLALSRVDLQQQWNVLRSTIYSTRGHASVASPGAGAH